MRKRRRLADKLTIMVCAVLVAVSAFFYAPMEVKASSLDNSYITNGSISALNSQQSGGISIPLRQVTFIEGLSSDSFYRLNFDGRLVFKFDTSDYLYLRNIGITYGDNIYYQTRESTNELINGQRVVTLDFNCYFFGFGNEFVAKNMFVSSRFFGNFIGDYSLEFSFDNLSYLVLTGEESESYQQGYNAGYSAGEQAGEDIGYSNGFEEGFEQGESQGYESGFQSGQDSVDTDSYYDMGYSAGYDAGYLSGYDDGYEEGYSKALKSVQGSSGQWGSPMFVGTPTEIKRFGQSFYVSSYGLLDMEEYQSGVNGYFYNTVPGTYDGYTSISYNIPFYSFNNGLVKIDSDKFQIDFGLRDLDISVECDVGNGTELANLFESRLNEVYLVYNGRKYYGNYDIGTGYVEFDFIAEGVGNPTYLNTGSMTLVFNIHNTVTLVTDADVSHFISAKYHNVLECSLGIPSNSYAIYIRPYLENDRVSANIQDQTNSLTNGFNDSKGNSVNNDFTSGLNDFETAEDSLFATATTGLKDFTFFDFQSVPAMVTGMSFVGSIMSGWFTHAGGASGVGIVLSILFSIMLVAMVLGLYRWYQSKGGKD